MLWAQWLPSFKVALPILKRNIRSHKCYRPVSLHYAILHSPEMYCYDVKMKTSDKRRNIYKCLLMSINCSLPFDAVRKHKVQPLLSFFLILFAVIFRAQTWWILIFSFIKHWVSRSKISRTFGLKKTTPTFGSWSLLRLSMWLQCFFLQTCSALRGR